MKSKRRQGNKPFFMLMIILLLSLTACSSSVDQIKKEATNILEKSMDETVKEPTETTDNGTLYLPLFMSVEDVSENNIILKQGSQTYILFNNIHEGKASTVLYESMVSEMDQLLLEHSIEKDGTFAYVVIKEESKENVLLTVGIGGMKITTETEIKGVSDQTEKMMEILRSFDPKAKSLPSE